jgi:hypothetical protein
MVNPAPSLSLPLELVERIADELDGDAPSLAACARMCTSWRSLFQGRLFHTVKLATNTACMQLRWALVASSHLVALVRVLHLAQSPVLVRILVAAGSVVFWNVHTLIIDTSPYHEGLLGVLPGLRTLRLTRCTGYIESAPWMLNELVVERSCRLETVTIEGLHKSAHTGEVHELILSDLLRRHTVEDVVSAVLEWSSFISREALVKFICGTPSLRELSLVVYPFKTDNGEKLRVE